MKRIVVLLFLVFTSLFVNASDFKECHEEIRAFYYGDNGIIWMAFKDGSQAYIVEDNPNVTEYLAVITSAHMGRRPVTVRYSDSMVSCSDTVARNNIRGIWIH